MAKKRDDENNVEHVHETITKPQRYVAIKTKDYDITVSSYHDDIKLLNDLALKNVNAVETKKKKEVYIG